MKTPKAPSRRRGPRSGRVLRGSVRGAATLAAALLLGAALLLVPGSAVAQTTGSDHAPGGGAHSSLTEANRIRPGDLIAVEIWREPDMSGRFLVDEVGEIVLPRLGRMRVTDLTPEALQADVKSRYQQYLRNPSIDITILRRITVNGAVNAPGLYPVDPTHSIADVLAQAGGVTPAGDRENIRVLRRGDELEIGVSEVTRVAETPIRSGDMIFVPERSWISRHTGLVATGISAAVSLFIAFAVR